MKKKRTVHFYQNGILLPVQKCKRPRFSCHAGRTWDVETIYIDGVKYDAHLDTTWGKYLYFQYSESLQWYRVPMWSSINEDFKGKKFDVDPFEKEKSYITTNK